jgi:hypothetical protein
MDSIVKFTIVAVVSLIVAVPLWILILTGEFSMSMFANPELLFYMCFALIVLLYGFSKDHQEKTDE